MASDKGKGRADPNEVKAFSPQEVLFKHAIDPFAVGKAHKSPPLLSPPDSVAVESYEPPPFKPPPDDTVSLRQYKSQEHRCHHHHGRQENEFEQVIECEPSAKYADGDPGPSRSRSRDEMEPLLRDDHVPKSTSLEKVNPSA